MAAGADGDKIAKSRPAEHGLPFSTWSLSKLGEFLAAEGVVDDISHEGLRVLLREERVTFQRLKTWKTSTDPGYAVKKARAGHLYAIADREVTREPAEPEVIFCMDEFGPLNLQLHPGRQWAAANNAEIACTPTNSSWCLNRIEAQFNGAALLRPRRHRPPYRPARSRPALSAGTSSGATTTPTTNDSAGLPPGQMLPEAALAAGHPFGKVGNEPVNADPFLPHRVPLADRDCLVFQCLKSTVTQ